LLTTSKLDGLRLDYDACVSRLNTLKQELTTKQIQDRQELLGSDLHSRSSSTILDLNGYDTAHSSRLDTASSSVEEYVTLGKQSLQELYSQRDLLKVKRKCLQ
jgi:hypothetical protein